MGNAVLDKTFIAAEQISANTIVQMAYPNDFRVKTETSPGGAPIGIALNDAEEGEYVTVRLLGVAKLKLGEDNVEVGTYIQSNDNGEGIGMMNGNQHPALPIALALESGNAGELVDVLIQRLYIFFP